MQDYVDNVRLHVVGQGVVTEVNLTSSPSSFDSDLFPPPPSPEMLQRLTDQFGNVVVSAGDKRPPPALPRKPSSNSSSGGGADGVFTAKPYNAGVVAHSGGGAGGNLLGVPRPFGSTSSSLDSSRNESPSPTSSGEDHHSQSPFALQRPSQFGSNGGAGGSNGGDDGTYSVPRSLDGPDDVDGPVVRGGQPQQQQGRGDGGQKNRHQHRRSKDAAAVARCQECKGDLFPGDVAVQADRAGKDKMWHPRCFKCFECRVSHLPGQVQKQIKAKSAFMALEHAKSLVNELGHARQLNLHTKKS